MSFSWQLNMFVTLPSTLYVGTHFILTTSLWVSTIIAHFTVEEAGPQGKCSTEIPAQVVCHPLVSCLATVLELRASVEQSDEVRLGIDT
jgi:hypothetical protein